MMLASGTFWVSVCLTIDYGLLDPARIKARANKNKRKAAINGSNGPNGPNGPNLAAVEAQRGNDIDEDEDGLPPPVDGSVSSTTGASAAGSKGQWCREYARSMHVVCYYNFVMLPTYYS